jgi:RNA polymerase-binding transcription factor DksA
VPIEKWEAPPEISRAAFNKKQKARLLDLKDSLVDSMNGMAADTLRARAEGSEASAFGMHQADAGSDAYDRDFALSLLSKEQDALFEIEEALKRLEDGTYGICDMCNKPIPQARLEALPFARFTIDCQAEYEREVGPGGGRRPLRSLFGLMGDEDDEEEGEEKETVDKAED